MDVMRSWCLVDNLQLMLKSGIALAIWNHCKLKAREYLYIQKFDTYNNGLNKRPWVCPSWASLYLFFPMVLKVLSHVTNNSVSLLWSSCSLAVKYISQDPKQWNSFAIFFSPKINLIVPNGFFMLLFLGILCSYLLALYELLIQKTLFVFPLGILCVLLSIL